MVRKKYQMKVVRISPVYVCERERDLDQIRTCGQERTMNKS